MRWVPACPPIVKPDASPELLIKLVAVRVARFPVVPNKFVLNKLVDVAAVVVEFLTNKFVVEAVVAKKFVEVAFVVVPFVANKFVVEAVPFISSRKFGFEVPMPTLPPLNIAE